MRYSVVGKRIPRIDAAEKVTGRASYVDDLHLPGMLQVRLVCSPRPRARVRGIDGSKALRLPGVVAMVTEEEVPTSGRRSAPMAFKGEVSYEGEVVAAVAAEDRHTAEEAARLVEVDYEVLPAVSDLAEAIQAEAPVVRDNPQAQQDVEGRPLPANAGGYGRYVKGDVEKGFAEADYIFEDSFRTMMQHQGYIEPRGTVATYEAKTDSYTVWTSTAGQHTTAEDLSDLFGISVNQVRVIGVTQGGGFGGKNRYCIEPICMALARKTGRPVKLTLTHEEDMRFGLGRPQEMVEIKTGVKKDGTLVARKARIYSLGGGNYPMITGPYRIDNVEVETVGVVANTPPPSAFRAPGTPEVHFAVESQMDIIAKALGIDPFEIRMKNLVKEGEFVFWNKEMPKAGWREVLQAVVEKSGWKTRKKRRNHGWGLACGKWPCHSGRSSAHVTMNRDGSVNVITGVVDVTGSHTALLQIAAEVLGLGMDKVSLTYGDSQSSPPVEGSWGSRIIYGVGNAVRIACEQIREQLLQAAAKELGVKSAQREGGCAFLLGAADALEMAEGKIRTKRAPRKSIAVSELAKNIHSESGPIIGQGSLTNLPMAPVLAAQVAEVKVDPETGEVEVLRITSAQNIGVAINPPAVEGQVEGAVVQGMGFGLTEGYFYSQAPEARFLNPGFLDYRLPTSLDAPEITSVLVEDPAEFGPFGARGAGEPPVVPTAPAIANAIEDAVGARVTALPITPDKIIKALRERKRRG